MHYIYILHDDLNRTYVGYSSNLRSRLNAHLRGTTTTTAKFINPQLIYYEAYTTEELARKREKMLKMYGSSYTGLLKRLGLK